LTGPPWDLQDKRDNIISAAVTVANRSRKKHGSVSGKSYVKLSFSRGGVVRPSRNIPIWRIGNNFLPNSIGDLGIDGRPGSPDSAIAPEPKGLRRRERHSLQRSLHETGNLPTIETIAACKHGTRSGMAGNLPPQQVLATAVHGGSADVSCLNVERVDTPRQCLISVAITLCPPGRPPPRGSRTSVSVLRLTLLRGIIS